MKRITTTQLSNWAPENDCRENFGLLLRRLINNSPAEVLSMLFPAGENVNLPGYDGSLLIKGSFMHIPDGESVWEWGTGKNFQDKATREKW